MAFSSLHLPAGSTSLRPEELAAVTGGCCHGGRRQGHGHGCRPPQAPDCPWQRRHTQLCALDLDCPYYADPDQP